MCVLRPILTLTLAAAVATAGGAAVAPEKQAQFPAAATRPIDFARDIQPIFEASCVQCHGRGKDKGAFSLETREDFLAGGDNGAPAIVGKSAESPILELITSRDPETVMPKKGKKLTAEQVGIFRAWIDQGMPWPKEITFFKHEPANLRARELADIAVPNSSATIANPVDRFVDAAFAKNKIAWPAPVSDRVFARRAWLDAIGLLPPPEELEAFVVDVSPDKRARLVSQCSA